MRWLLLAALLTGCGYKKNVKNLTDSEFDHYYALRVFMSEDQVKTYLKKETADERNAYLKEIGLWDRFYKYSDREREQIVRGDVAVGWTQDKVLMSWGDPYEFRKLPGRKAERSELWVYRFEVGEDGAVRVWTKDSKTYYKATRLFVRELTLDDGKVAEIEEKDAHW